MFVYKYQWNNGDGLPVSYYHVGWCLFIFHLELLVTQGSILLEE